MEPVNEVKYSEVAPLISKHIKFEDIPVKEVKVNKPLANITKTKLNKVLANNDNPTRVARLVGLSKGQVMKIRKEYQAAIRHKSSGGK